MGVRPGDEDLAVADYQVQASVRNDPLRAVV
jgi:hypothetical protein